SQNPEIRDYARRMIDEHEQVDDDLRDTVRHSGYRMRGMANDVDQKHRTMLRQLERASPSDFDWHYVRMQTQAHDEAVRLYRNYANRGSNRALREFAREKLP